MAIKIMQIVDKDTGNIDMSREFAGEYAFQFADDNRDILHIGHINSANFAPDREIKNTHYAPIAAKLIERFEELAHINVHTILFLENTRWKPPKKKAKKTWIARVKKADTYLENAWCYSYVMEIKEYFVSRMSHAQIFTLLYHELRHIGEEDNLRPHDIEDWDNIVATLGANWADFEVDIKNILGVDFPGWNDINAVGKQLTLFPNAKIEQAAKSATP